MPSGSFTFSNNVHSCAWRGLAASSEIATRLCRKDEVDDVRERHVAVVRTLVVAPAQVHAQLFRRDVCDRVIERLDVQLRALAEFRQAQVRVLDVTSHAEVGAVDLQHEAGFGDGFVFVTHRIGDRVDVGLEILVVVVAKEQRHHAGRGGAHEATRGLHILERSLEIVGIGLRRLLVPHADRRVAGGRLAARAARIAEHAFFQAREVGKILVHERIARAAESVEPVLDVGGVARLRQLAVIDQVDAGIGLLAGRFRPPPRARAWQVPLDRRVRLLPWRTSCG